MQQSRSPAVKPKAAHDRKVPVHVMMDIGLLARIDRAAETEAATRSELIRRALEDRFASMGAGPAVATRTEKVVVADRQFTAHVERDGKWWIASVAELPGCGTQGRTLAELRDMLADAIEGYLIVRGDIADPLVARS